MQTALRDLGIVYVLGFGVASAIYCLSHLQRTLKGEAFEGDLIGYLAAILFWPVWAIRWAARAPSSRD